MRTIPVSVVIATADRPGPLSRTMASLIASTLVPEQFVIVDGSATPESAKSAQALFAPLAGVVRVDLRPALQRGAAAQRNQAMTLAAHPYVLFCDDDIIAEPDCIERLWNALQADEGVGGACALIVNQSYVRPSRALRMLLAVLGEPEGQGYAGRVVAPAIQFLPRDDSSASAVPVEWLATTCTMYRCAYLPDPPFDSFFTGYSIGEDVALSLRVGKKARLVNVPAARVFHDSQQGPHKSDAVAVHRMDLVNRHYIMTQVMGRRRWRDNVKLLAWELCQLGDSVLRHRGGVMFRQRLHGRLLGLADILRGHSGRNAR